LFSGRRNGNFGTTTIEEMTAGGEKPPGKIMIEIKSLGFKSRNP
jgi:hypothetical protein